MKFIYIALLVIAVPVAFADSAPINYLPLPPEDPASAKPAMPLPKAAWSTRPLGDGKAAISIDLPAGTSQTHRVIYPVCDPVPAAADVKGALTVRRSVMSAAAATNLMLTGIDLNTNANQMVVVQEWARGVDCLATDGETMLRYGQAIRMTVSASSIDGETNITLAGLAAKATIQGKSSQVDLKVLGLDHPQLNTIASVIASEELDVESFQKFNEVQKNLMELVDKPQTTHKVVRLGILPSPKDAEFRHSSVVAFALSEIAQGRSCKKAIERFPHTNNGEAAMIEAVYFDIVKGCTSNTPDQSQKARASSLSYGLKVRD